MTDAIVLGCGFVIGVVLTLILFYPALRISGDDADAAERERGERRS